MFNKIDKIRDKFDKVKPLSLREFCFVLWAEYSVCSSQYMMFAYWIKSNKLPYKNKFKSNIWKSLYDGFCREYSVLREDNALNIKIKKMGMKVFQ